jgi:hypothetical protein
VRLNRRRENTTRGSFRWLALILLLVCAALANAQSHPAFFAGETATGGGWYYLQFPDLNVFGYYNYSTFSSCSTTCFWMNHSTLGWLYYEDAGDSAHGAPTCMTTSAGIGGTRVRLPSHICMTRPSMPG